MKKLRNNKKIILVKFDSEYAIKYNYPLSIVTVGSALKNAGFDVELIHCYDDDLDNVANDVIEKNPLFIGFSVITSASILLTVKASKVIKEKSKIPIVWGGIHPSLLPEQCISEEYVDIIVIGEGEETIIEVAKKLDNNESLDGVMGVWFKNNGTIIKNEPRGFIKDFSRSRLDFSLLDPSRYYHELHGSRKGFDYMSSRGCPHHCRFCYNAKFNKRTWRPMSEEIVLDDIQFLKRTYNIEAVYFVDDNFYVNKKRALNILKRINLPTYTEIRIDYITDEFAKELKEMNPKLVLVGAESGSNRILQLIGKDFEIEDTKRAVQIFAKYHIPVHYSFIMGLPTETREETEKTIDFMLWIHKAHKEALFTIGQYMPYPGSELYEVAIEKGFKPPETTEEWYKIDRFQSTVELPWIDKKFCYYVREYFFFFATRISFIQKICAIRLKYKFFAFPIELKIMQLLYRQIKFGNPVIKKIGRGLLRAFQSV